MSAPGNRLVFAPEARQEFLAAERYYNTVDKVRWAPDAEGAMGRVYINAEQCFGKVPAAVWDMHIGGYRVAEKWLKDRKGRPLTYDDLTHYQSVIAALARTLQLQADIDVAIDGAGGWPLK